MNGGEGSTHHLQQGYPKLLMRLSELLYLRFPGGRGWAQVLRDQPVEHLHRFISLRPLFKSCPACKHTSFRDLGKG